MLKTKLKALRASDHPQNAQHRLCINCYKNDIAPDVGTDVAETVSKDVEDIVDTGQDRSSTN